MPVHYSIALAFFKIVQLKLHMTKFSLNLKTGETGNG
jgi:hypothetical protein